MKNNFILESYQKLCYVTPKEIIEYMNKHKYDCIIGNPKYKGIKK
jgi:hypothetical protein